MPNDLNITTATTWKEFTTIPATKELSLRALKQCLVQCGKNKHALENLLAALKGSRHKSSPLQINNWLARIVLANPIIYHLLKTNELATRWQSLLRKVNMCPQPGIHPLDLICSRYWYTVAVKSAAIGNRDLALRCVDQAVTGIKGKPRLGSFQAMSQFVVADWLLLRLAREPRITERSRIFSNYSPLARYLAERALKTQGKGPINLAEIMQRSTQLANNHGAPGWSLKANTEFAIALYHNDYGTGPAHDIACEQMVISTIVARSLQSVSQASTHNATDGCKVDLPHLTGKSSAICHRSILHYAVTKSVRISVETTSNQSKNAKSAYLSLSNYDLICKAAPSSITDPSPSLCCAAC